MSGAPEGAESHPQEIGTVAEETARLLRVLRADPSPLSDGNPAPSGMPWAARADRAGTGGTARMAGTAADADGLAGHAGAEPAGAEPAGAAGHSSDCTWCPICRGIAFVRGADPESVDRLIQGATLVASALVDLANSLARPPMPPQSSRPATHAASHSTSGPVSGEDGPAEPTRGPRRHRDEGAS